MTGKEQDVFAKAAAQMQKNVFPVLVKTGVQDRAQLERLYPKGSDGKSTLGEDTPDPVWFVEEHQLNGDWPAIDRAEDQDEAEAKHNREARYVTRSSAGTADANIAVPKRPPLIGAKHVRALFTPPRYKQDHNAWK